MNAIWIYPTRADAFQKPWRILVVKAQGWSDLIYNGLLFTGIKKGDRTGLTSGLYFCLVEAGNQDLTVKRMIVK